METQNVLYSYMCHLQCSYVQMHWYVEDINIYVWRVGHGREAILSEKYLGQKIGFVLPVTGILGDRYFVKV